MARLPEARAMSGHATAPPHRHGNVVKPWPVDLADWLAQDALADIAPTLPKEPFHDDIENAPGRHLDGFALISINPPG
jgi:hypothetical protein